MMGIGLLRPTTDFVPVPRQFSKTRQPADIGLETPRLRLLITGFEAQALVTTREIVEAVDRLPAFHLEHLREISYEPWPEGSLPLAGGHEGGGWPRYGEYLQRSRKITLYYFSDRTLFYQMLFHEIGHHVFFLILNSRIKKHWVTVLHRAAPCITPYAASSPSEDFAESYAAFVLNPEELKRIPEKYDYMRDAVFSGLPATLKERISGDAARP